MYNKIIQSTVNNFYDDLKHARDMVTLKSALSTAISRNQLNEAHHIVNTFMQCAKDIIAHIDNYDDAPKYSGWIFDRQNNICLKTTTLIQESLPIYIRIINDNSYDNVMAVQDRSKCDDKICLIINKVKLLDIHNNIGILGHEFRHALEMYVDPKKSHIGDNIVDVINDIDLQKRFENTPYYNDALNIVTLFLKSEERARLNGAIHFLMSKNIDISDINKSSEKLAFLVKESESQHQLSTMRLWLDELQERVDYGLYLLPLLVGYLWNKYNNEKINVEISIDDISNKNDNGEDVCDKIMAFLNKNYKDFYSELIDDIATHIVIGLDEKSILK